MARQTKKAIFENKTKTEILADDMIFEMRGMLDPDPEKMERVKSLFMLCLFISQNASSMKPNSDEQANELSKLGRQFRDTQNTIMLCAEIRRPGFYARSPCSALKGLNA